MKQITFRCLKELLTTNEDDAAIPGDYVAVWMDRRVLDELIHRRTVEADENDQRHPTNKSGRHQLRVSALVTRLLESAGYGP